MFQSSITERHDVNVYNTLILCLLVVFCRLEQEKYTVKCESFTLHYIALVQENLLKNKI